MRIKTGFKQRIALGLVCLLIITYTVYHVINLFGEDYTTYAAGITTEKTVVSYNGYLFKDEQVLTSENTGIVDYLVPDGTKVGKGQSVATVYEENASEQPYISRLDEYISIFERSTGDSIENIDYVAQNKENSDTYDAIIKLLVDGDSSGLEYNINKLLVGINISDEIKAVDRYDGSLEGTKKEQTLESLRAEKDALFSKSGKGITCNVSEPGYFFSETDGCEGYFTIAAADSITHDTYRELVNVAMSPKPVQGAYGKLGKSSQWKLVMAVSRADIKHFETEQTYSAVFSENNGTELPLYLEKIVKGGSTDDPLLIFRCDRLPKNFSFDRCQSVSITVDTESGIYVPKDIVIREEGRIGVYILRGSVVQFRYIDIVYERSDYYLVKHDSEDKDGRKYLRENDMIILNITNLFDGRILK
jgi:hypothetical protein